MGAVNTRKEMIAMTAASTTLFWDIWQYEHISPITLSFIVVNKWGK
jgi:hypothetical protein